MMISLFFHCLNTNASAPLAVLSDEAKIVVAEQAHDTPQPQEAVKSSLGESTFAMIKPDAIAAGNTGAIVTLIEKNGFTIVQMKKMIFTSEQAASFYAEHKDRSFYTDLMSYITSGPVIVMELAKENAVSDWRKLIGSTDPVQAEVGTIRKMFGTSKSYNAVHGSDSVTSGKKEIMIIFGS